MPRYSFIVEFWLIFRVDPILYITIYIRYFRRIFAKARKKHHFREKYVIDIAKVSD